MRIDRLRVVYSKPGGINYVIDFKKLVNVCIIQ